MTGFDEFAEMERQGWSDPVISEGYVTRFAEMTRQAVPEIVALVPEGVAVLDLCCGQADIAAALQSKCCDVTGADFSHQMIEFARERVHGVNFVWADAQALPFDGHCFDAVVCGFGLMHVPDQPAALAEVARVLRPGGLFVMSCWEPPQRSDVFGTVFGAIMAHGDPSVTLPDSPDFYQFAEEGHARAAFAEAGLAHQERTVFDAVLRLEDPGALMDLFATAAPRGGYLLRHQPDDAKARIRAAVALGVQERGHQAEDGLWEIKAPVAINRGVRAG